MTVYYCIRLEGPSAPPPSSSTVPSRQMGAPSQPGPSDAALSHPGPSDAAAPRASPSAQSALHCLTVYDCIFGQLWTLLDTFGQFGRAALSRSSQPM
eukprot:4935322-Pyramimonas_sp.AAC.1